MVYKETVDRNKIHSLFQRALELGLFKEVKYEDMFLTQNEFLQEIRYYHKGFGIIEYNGEFKLNGYIFTGVLANNKNGGINLRRESDSRYLFGGLIKHRLRLNIYGWEHSPMENDYFWD